MPTMLMPMLQPALRLALFLALGMVTLATLSSCANRTTDRWQPERKGTTFAVVFVPVDTTPIDALFPEASQQFAFDLANRVNFLGRDARGWVAADAPRATSALVVLPVADWTVSTRLLTLDLGPSPFGPQWVAKVEMRVADSSGREVFRKTTHGTKVDEVSPKLMSPAAKPQSQAAWSACGEAVSALIEHLKLRNEIPLPPVVPAVPTVTELVKVQLTIASTPDHADVLIDGKFRGTTPLAVTLPSLPVEIRIERQGRQPWIRTLTPEVGMQLAPALEELAPAPVPVPSPVPAVSP
jgi:hypothetical protein